MIPPPIEPHDRDHLLLASLLAWEDLLGSRPLSWVDLKSFGSTLGPQEAEQYLKGELSDPARGRLYEALFEAHPGMRSYVESGAEAKIAAMVAQDIAQAQELTPNSQFVARFTDQMESGAERELAAFLQRAGTSGTAWLPTRTAGESWAAAIFPGESVGLFIYRHAAGISAVVARIKERKTEMPADPTLHSAYPDAKSYQAWWHLARPRQLHFADWSQIPGHSREHKMAAENFGRSQLAFAYWKFGLPMTEMVQRFASK